MSMIEQTLSLEKKIKSRIDQYSAEAGVDLLTGKKDGNNKLDGKKSAPLRKGERKRFMKKIHSQNFSIYLIES